MDSMLAQNSAPTTKPMIVPLTPMLAPAIKKMRMIAPRDAPIVRRIAMSADLSFTSITRPEIILSAATRMMSERMRNITFFSTSTAPNRLEFVSCQVRTRE